MSPAASSNENLRGILFMVAACTGFILNDTFVKLASEEFLFPQIIVLRSWMAPAHGAIVLLASGSLRKTGRGR
jgi:hypothetical protein